MKRILSILVLVPVGIVMVALAVANRRPALVSLDPFSYQAPAISFQMPLFLIVFASVAVGILIGGFATWLSQGRNRRAARENRRAAERWRIEAEQMKARDASSGAPALPPARRNAA